MSHLSTQVIVENFQESQLLIHAFRVVRLLLLDNVPPGFDDSLNFKFDFTQRFI